MQKVFLAQLVHATLRPSSSSSSSSASSASSVASSSSSSSSSHAAVYVWQGKEIPERVWVQVKKEGEEERDEEGRKRRETGSKEQANA